VSAHHRDALPGRTWQRFASRGDTQRARKQNYAKLLFQLGIARDNGDWSL